MKKIDKLILTSFLGPFVLTFLVVVFILLNIHMLKYFDDIIGKDLGWDVIGQLLFYFAIFNTPVALPLAVLLSSLITFGNLGEHFELTAIKSLGISLLRSLLPIFGFVLLITLGAFLIGNYMVPKAALEAYSLLWDIKQKKPALDLRQGVFYNSIPGISIKVNYKTPDTGLLKGIIIYDHRGRSGNKAVIVADSGRMYTILNDSYLKLELFHGYDYLEGNTGPQNYSSGTRQDESYRKTQFDKSQIVFDLSSFGLNRTDKKWFQSNRLMRNMKQLQDDMDSVDFTIRTELISVYASSKNMFNYYSNRDKVVWPDAISQHKHKRDSIAFSKNDYDPALINAKPVLAKPDSPDMPVTYLQYSDHNRYQSDSIFRAPYSESELASALTQARTAKAQLLTNNANLKAFKNEKRIFYIQWHKIMAQAIACIAMFLIGAPLGAIIKKGGLGVPVLMSILFFILFYVLSLMGEKWAKQSVLSVETGMWLANVTLFIIGFMFLRQARADARLFDADFYSVIWDRLTRRFSKKTE
ncbi:MAG TPA: LptF/LptG family permease [Cyclobacteriaceae bacterium]|jgi:lipopolysaccharide export system permease protein|nr:LptF/LptG family permease [Cytophagales bacterium]HRF32719.1 LptF/LptG family permease [Cyclobacteriaceae bacterium]